MSASSWRFSFVSRSFTDAMDILKECVCAIHSKVSHEIAVGITGYGCIGIIYGNADEILVHKCVGTHELYR